MADLHKLAAEIEALTPQVLDCEHSATQRLVAILKSHGFRVTFDPGRSFLHPCTFCGTADSPRKLVTIGRYGNGDDLTRPVCYGCAALGEHAEQMLKGGAHA